MEKKTTVVLNPQGVIKNITLSVGILEGLQNLLVHYLAQCKDHDEIVETYKKINKLSTDEKVVFEGIQSHIYILVALVQNLRLLALEQGVAKEVEVEDAVHMKAKEAAQMFLERDPAKLKELNKKLRELHDVTSNLNH